MNKCVGCGYCCKKASCALSVQLFGNATECPVLNFKNDIYTCGLIEMSKGDIKERYKKHLAIGEGCCSSLNSDRRNIIKKEKKEKKENPIELHIPIKDIFNSFLSKMSNTLYNSSSLFLILNSMKHDLIKKGHSEEAVNDTVKKLALYFGTTRTDEIQNFMG